MKLPVPFEHVVLRNDPYGLEMDDAGKYGDSNACDAEINQLTHTIYVREDAESRSFLEILGHEWAHHVLMWSGLSAILCKYDRTGQLEEGICDAFGKGLVEFIRQNIPIVKYIWKEDAP